MTARCARAILAVTSLWAAARLQGQTGSLEIVTDTLPTATQGAAYLQQLITTGGQCSATGTATASIDDGALPNGIAVTSGGTQKQWALQGTPSNVGTFRFTVHLRWSHQAVSPFDHTCVDEAVKTLTLVVQGSQAQFTVDRFQIVTTYHTSRFPPSADVVRVTSLGGSAVPFTAQAIADSGGAWLSVSPQSGTTPAVLTINYSITGLAAGIYTGRVIVNGTTPITVAVTLTVIADANIPITASPAAVTFTATTGSPDPPGQAITVSAGTDNVLFQASVSAPPNGKWLTVNPTGGATPAKITASIVSKDLAPGVYSGAITMTVAGAVNSSKVVPVTLILQAPVPRPTVTDNGVINAAGLGSAIAPGTWVSIFGTALAPVTRPWLGSDFVNGVLPVSLDGVSVTINGKPAAVAFISPTQINVLAPDDTATGLVPLQVKTPAGTSDSALVLEQTAAPAFFQLSGGNRSYVAGTHADGSYLAGPALVQSGIPGVPARPGEVVVLFGTGFGATNPPISATAQVPSALPLARPEDLRIRIGGLDATIAFAGLISPGLYQFNVTVPQVDDGDVPVVAEFRGLLTRSDLLLSVKR
jgi:uncharacterized protein (TIGR03437 family)